VSRTVFDFPDGTTGPGRWSPEDGGRVVPAELVSGVVLPYVGGSVYRTNPGPLPPPTRTQRLRYRWAVVRNRITTAWDVLRGTHACYGEYD
jgi:hypothetical protein